MRGKGNFHVVTHTKVGITPAYAGKRIAELQTPAVSWDHPRVCGEKKPLPACPAGRQGSPPRMRGKACLKRPSGPGLRITPAYAGKSRLAVRQRVSGRDHPRVCGEKQKHGRKKQYGLGSPPRMRGKEINTEKGPSEPRITPAYAGKSLLVCHAVVIQQDHPRVCGEKTKKIP